MKVVRRKRRSKSLRLGTRESSVAAGTEMVGRDSARLRSPGGGEEDAVAAGECGEDGVGVRKYSRTPGRRRRRRRRWRREMRESDAGIAWAGEKRTEQWREDWRAMRGADAGKGGKQPRGKARQCMPEAPEAGRRRRADRGADGPEPRPLTLLSPSHWESPVTMPRGYTWQQSISGVPHAHGSCHSVHIEWVTERATKRDREKSLAEETISTKWNINELYILQFVNIDFLNVPKIWEKKTTKKRKIGKIAFGLKMKQTKKS